MKDYFKKIEENIYQNLYWNFPEQKLGKMNVIGGNVQNFRTSIKIAENFRKAEYPISEIRVILPDILKGKLPSMPEFVFLGSTDSGSFADKEGLEKVMNEADFNLVIGDLSKNSITQEIVGSAVESSEKPLLITRDAVDLITVKNTEKILENENVLIFGSMAQLQKIFRAIFYPKMLLLSQPLLSVAETLHKFTLSYKATIITLHMGQFLIAKDGEVVAVPFEKAKIPIIATWDGELATRIAGMNLFNPKNFFEASIAGIFER